jgi:amidohydrolase
VAILLKETTFMSETKLAQTFASLATLLPELEAVYKDIHAHPELSMQETRTAGIAANHLKALAFDVTTGVGKTGVVGILRNGDGPTVMLRADMDALPIKEATGLPYASTVTGTDPSGKTVPVAHSCGHDMHVACLIGATSLFAKSRDAWRGTLMAVFQPGEETAQGAKAMIDDGMFKRFPKPDVALGQHVMSLPSGNIDWRAGVVSSSAIACRFACSGGARTARCPSPASTP